MVTSVVGMHADPESTPRKAGLRAEQINVVAPTVFTVGLMQGSTPRKAGCVRCRYACAIIGSGRWFGEWRNVHTTRFADAITVCFPMHPAHAGCYLALSPR